MLVEGFYRDLQDFRLYVSYTQDMPSTLADRYDFVLDRLQKYGRPALAALGGVPARPVVVTGTDPALVGGLGAGPREAREGDPEYYPPSGVVYEELPSTASIIAAELGPSPAALAETEEERKARADWRRNGKVFRPNSDDGEA